MIAKNPEQPMDRLNKLITKLFPKSTRRYTHAQLATRLQLRTGQVSKFCAEGLVPYARRLDRAWLIDRRGAVFLYRWLARYHEFKSLWRAVVGQAAAKLDPACVPRQQDAQAQHQPRKLTLADIKEIRTRRRKGESLSRIAADKNIHFSTVSYIGSRRSYPDLN